VVVVVVVVEEVDITVVEVVVREIVVFVCFLPFAVSFSSFLKMRIIMPVGQ